MKLKRHIIVIVILTSLLIASFCVLYDPFKLIVPVKTIYLKEPNKNISLPNRTVMNLDNWENHHFYHCCEDKPPGYLLYHFPGKAILGARISVNFDCSDGDFSISYSLDNQNYQIMEPAHQIQSYRDYVLDFKDTKVKPANLWLKTNLFGRRGWCNLVSYSAEVYSLEGSRNNAMAATGFFVIFFIVALCVVVSLAYLHSKVMQKLFFIPKDFALTMSFYVISMFSLFLLFPVFRVLFPNFLGFNTITEMYSLLLLSWRVLFLSSIFVLIAYSTCLSSRVTLIQNNEYRISRFILLLCFFYGVIYFFNNQITGDGAQYFSWLHSIFIDHDINFKNEVEYITMAGWGTGVLQILPTRIGTCLAWLPLYAGTHFVLLGLKAIKATNFEVNGWTLPYFTSVTFTSLIASFCGLVISYKLLRRFFSFSVALLSATMVYLGTPIFTWTFVHPSYNHAVDFCIVSVFIYYWITTFNSRTFRQWMILGMIFFFLVIIREQNIFFGFLLIAEAIVRYSNRDRKKFRFSVFLRDYVLFLFIFTGGLAVLAFLAFEGGFLKNFLYASSLSYFNPLQSLRVIYVLLFYPTTGLLTATPLVNLSFFGIISIFLLHKKPKRTLFLTTIGFLLIFLAEFIYLTFNFNPTILQFNIGARYFINITFLLMLGLGFLFEYVSKYRIASLFFKTLAWIAIIYYLLLNIQYQGHIITYLGEGSPLKQILSQQINLAYRLIPDALTKRIFWSEPKLISYFVEWNRYTFFYYVFVVVLFIFCFKIFTWIMLPKKSRS